MQYKAGTDLEQRNVRYRTGGFRKINHIGIFVQTWKKYLIAWHKA